MHGSLGSHREISMRTIASINYGSMDIQEAVEAWLLAGEPDESTSEQILEIAV
jgi:hypothetical protein